ncbi:hypothetical protein OUZ56_021909 [Daphnia magna]|uniref:Uncharacterized protein n=1 Tax=Daphnia magna TaxID=35525 RepID=A0ABR0AUX7_9CRUS|nr:hypothetical protein OUZ56_021909 [Daphnia magna]
MMRLDMHAHICISTRLEALIEDREGCARLIGRDDLRKVTMVSCSIDSEDDIFLNTGRCQTLVAGTRPHFYSVRAISH